MPPASISSWVVGCCGGLHGPYYGDMPERGIADKEVMDAVNQRIFRANHNHSYMVLPNHFFNGGEIVYIELHVFGYCCRAGVSGSYI